MRGKINSTEEVTLHLFFHDFKEKIKQSTENINCIREPTQSIINISKIDDVIEEVMKMEVLPVQSQFQGQFGVMGSSKIKGKQVQQIHCSRSIHR